MITAKGNDLYTIKPSYSSTLVLAVAKGGTKKGTPIVLETESGQPWQEWKLNKNDNGSYCLIPAARSGKRSGPFRRQTGSRSQDRLVDEPVPAIRICNGSSGRWPAPRPRSPLAPPRAPRSDYVPPEIKPDEVRKGEVKNFAFSSSKIFPGTNRQVTVFIPAQYNGSKPACVYVKNGRI